MVMERRALKRKNNIQIHALETVKHFKQIIKLINFNTIVAAINKYHNMICFSFHFSSLLSTFEKKMQRQIFIFNDTIFNAKK